MNAGRRSSVLPMSAGKIRLQWKTSHTGKIPVFNDATFPVTGQGLRADKCAADE